MRRAMTVYIHYHCGWAAGYLYPPCWARAGPSCPPYKVRALHCTLIIMKCGVLLPCICAGRLCDCLPFAPPPYIYVYLYSVDAWDFKSPYPRNNHHNNNKMYATGRR